MNAISHEQAQAYLHAATDESLGADEKALLAAHLLGCDVCQVYAREIARLESALRTTMQRRWGVSSHPLRLDQIPGWQKATPLRRVPSVVATPILVVFLVMLAVVLTRGSIFGGSETSTPSATVLATSIPTPSVELVRTNSVSAAAPSSTTSACEFVRYTIQSGDTMASIAEKFGLSVQAIRDANLLSDADVLTDEIIIPICSSTPGKTQTNTPSLTPTSYTP